MARIQVSPELAVAAILSIALHAFWLVQDAKASYVHELKPSELLFEAESLPTPKAPAESPPPEKTPPEQIERSSAARAHAEHKVASQVAAQAGKTLTAPDAPDNASLADFSMVQGDANMYSGGTTSRIGTSAAAVRGPASDQPAAAQRTAPSADLQTVEGPDRRRGATPSGTDWNCSSLFPNDPDSGDYATVVIAVTVLSNGKPKSVAVIRDTGHGFAAAARNCAMQQSYNVALDRAGKPTVATTPPIVVRFTR